MSKKAMELKKGIHESDFPINELHLRYLLDFKGESRDLAVFIHGLACTKETFINILDSGYFQSSSILLIDLVGFGRSSKPEDFSYAMEDQAGLCEALINNVPGQGLHIVAHSMGGAVALLFSKDFLERVYSFANVEGNLVEEDCGMFSRDVANASFHQYHAKIFEEQKSRWAEDELLRFDRTTPVAVYRSSQSLVKWSDSGELLENFKRLKNKKCYFWGEENLDMPVLKKLGSIEKCMISKSGHGMMIDNPEEFYSKLEKFLFS